jgi:acyl-CoA reductase-like NAD-dependent aldehyde dehydrogenase
MVLNVENNERLKVMVIHVNERIRLLRSAFPALQGGALPLWIGGEWVAASSQRLMPCIDPTVALPLIDVAVAAPDDIERAVIAATRAQQLWWESDGQDRARILRRIADGIRSRKEALGTLDTLDAGRPIRDTISRDVERAARIFEFFAGMTDRLRGAVVPAQPGRTNFIEYEPIGLVGAITPWNYPLTNAAGKIAPALATGNAVLLKPAEQSPLSALLLALVAHESGLPPGLLNVLNGPGELTGEAIVADDRIGKIAFTGSTAVGRHVAELASRNLKSVTLELGGKTGFVVFADADLERAADALVFSAMNNAGQTCTAASRLLLETSISDSFLRLISDRINRIAIGDPLEPATQVGPLISAKQKGAVVAYCKSAIAAGVRQARLEPRPVPEQGYFVEPKVFLDVDPRSRLAQDEIFGPVVAHATFRTESEATDLVNGTSYGLATTIWTRDLARGLRMSRRSQSGLVWVNNVHTLHPGSPYGGYKNSGIGVEMGDECIRQHMKLKSIWIDEGNWQTPWAQ